ncbi:hypothetical protein [Mycobacterium sp. 852014-52144_SCH5372336]|uniref:hypothetical protein n=1 Tax=Mycobacterium sp. 852014-52144_SCH5372336 TaxID=1834115 RepID=UPI0008006092|nr:hypothetical protein [Mycobacterium sp. 852014-52144_SCH5372336]OBB76807.1 hypothetical protein A5759_05220 [Mycobacterium sp. 852014-52144_SCH5372336]
MTAVGSPVQAAEKLAADLTGIADRLMTLRGRADWSADHDALVGAAIDAVTAAATSTAADRARRVQAAADARDDDRVRAHAARSPYRTPESDRRTGGPAAVAKKARAKARKRA